jgi:SAM-dependent methyltransferase
MVEIGSKATWKHLKRAYRAALDRPHERRLGISTGLVTPGLSNIEAQIQGHMGTPYRVLETIRAHMDRSGIAVPRFVDIGCGLGRPLYYFADRFEDLQGFEIVMSLHAAAQAQLEAVQAKNPDYARIAIHHADATAALPFDRPMVLFLYNPFGPKPMARLCERLRAAEHEIHLYYVLPMLAEQLAAALGRAPDATFHAVHDIHYYRIAPA